MEAVMGHFCWGLMFKPYDAAQEVFNAAYHLKQGVSEIMAWPVNYRRRMWELTEAQRRFEEKNK